MNENCVICLAIKLSSGIIFYVQINKIRIKWTTTSFCFTTSCSIPPIKDMVVLETQHCKRWSAACVQAKEATERRSWNNISIISIIYRPITYLRVISREQSLWSSLLSRGEGATDEDREKGRVEMNRGRGHAGSHGTSACGRHSFIISTKKL